MTDGQQKLLEQDAAFQRPPEDTDKLYMAIGDKDVIEVAHPAPADCAANLRYRQTRRLVWGLALESVSVESGWSN